MSTTPTPGARTRSIRHGMVVSVITFAVLWLVTPSAGAETIPVTVDQVGWWTDRAVAPEAGEGAFEVAAGPDGGAQSIAAFQVTIPASQVDTFALTLVEAAGVGGQTSGALAICPTTEPWTPADPGALEDAPEADCSRRVFMTPVLEDRVWIGDIASLVSDGGTVSLVVLADYTPPAGAVPLGPGMVVRISEIQIEADGTQSAAPTTTTTLDFTNPDGGNQFEESPDSGFSAPPVQDPGFSSGGSFDSGEPTVIEDRTETAAPAGEVDGDLAADDDEFFSLELEDAVAGDGRPWIRLLVLVPLSGAIGFGSARLRRMAKEGALLGGPV